VRYTILVISAALGWSSTCAPVSGQGPLDAGGDVTPVAISADASSLAGCQVIARIEGQVVLASEVLWKINKLIESRAGQIPPEQLGPIREELTQSFVAELLDRKLIYAEFRRNVPAENLPRIEETLAAGFEKDEVPKLMKELEVGSREELEKELVRLGSSLADARRAFNERTIAQFWVQSKIKINEEVSPDEMLEYYQSHLADYEYPLQVRWEELEVRKARFPTEKQAFEEIAGMGNEVWHRAMAQPGGLHGPAFADVAKARSDGFNAKEGGQYDWTTKGALKDTVIDQSLFSLQIGQMSEILSTDASYHIVRVLERKEAGRRPFTEVQGEIRDKLKERRFQVAVGEYLDRLHRESRVWTAQTGDVSAQTFLARARGETQQR
jgi:hypothetical protein